MNNPVTDSEFMEAVIWMGKVIPIFPSDPKAKNIIAKALASFVHSSDGLAWLTAKAIEEFEDWGKYGGIAGLKNLYQSYLRQLEYEQDNRNLLAWQAEKRKEIEAAPAERLHVVPIRPEKPTPKPKPLPDIPREELRALEEPDPDHPGQWRLKQTTPGRTPEEHARLIAETEERLKQLSER